MTNAQINRTFLSAVNSQSMASILNNIAQHYGITQQEALAEVTSDEAEHLLDYVTGPERQATLVLMRQAAL
jgi:hypothetical protein